MKLLTKTIEKKLPPLYAQGGLENDAVAYVKFFHPASNWTWFATEYDPVDKLFFGLVIGHEIELGYFSLDKLESVKVSNLKIERDLYFKPQTIGEIRVELGQYRNI